LIRCSHKARLDTRYRLYVTHKYNYRTNIDTNICLSVLSVTLVNSGQTVGWIKMKLGMQVVLGPGHIVLDGDLSRRGTAPTHFRPISLVAKWLDGLIYASWCGGRPRFRRLRRGPSSPSPKRGTEPPPQFLAHV